jgi:hypothetical protein
VRDHETRQLTSAVIAVLTSAGLTVGRGEKPAAGGWQGQAEVTNFVPYVVVYSLDGDLDGAIDYGAEDSTFRYQFSSIGATAEQAEWAADTARLALLATTPSVTGRRIGLITFDDLGGTVRDDKQQPPLWQVAERFTVMTTPA